MLQNSQLGHESSGLPYSVYVCILQNYCSKPINCKQRMKYTLYIVRLNSYSYAGQFILSFENTFKTGFLIGIYFRATIISYASYTNSHCV